MTTSLLQIDPLDILGDDADALVERLTPREIACVVDLLVSYELSEIPGRVEDLRREIVERMAIDAAEDAAERRVDR